MKRHKWIIGVINKLSSIACEMDSAAAIEGAKMTSSQREYYQNKIRKIYEELVKDLDK